MNNFMANNKEYEIQANNQLSVILLQFDEQYIMDIIDDTMQAKLNSFDLMSTPMAVQSFEENFKSYLEVYPAQQDLILSKRAETYREIIDHICKRFEMEFVESEGLDLYTMAYYLYDFFVSRFNNYLVTFYSNYIDKEKESIYSNMGLESLSKNKDMSTNYGKMVFKDNMIGLIVANLTTVIGNLRSMPVSDEYILDTIYHNPEVTALFLNHITPRVSLFSIFNNILFNPHLYPTIIIHIRMAIQMSNQVQLDTSKIDN